MTIDYSKWNPINLIFAPLFGGISSLITLLIDHVREGQPIAMEELILLVILLAFYLFMFIYRQVYYNHMEVKRPHVKL